jgi:hypothetical protein
MPTTQTDTEAVVVFGGGTNRNTTTTWNTRSRNVSTINGTKQLRIKPDGITCDWLWNDVQACDTTYRHQKHSPGPPYVTIFDEVLYEPLNATDATSPWNRVIGPNNDSRCVYKTAKCLSTTDCETVVRLRPRRITITDAVNTYFKLDEAGTMYWILNLYTLFGRSAKNEFIEGDFTANPIQGASADSRLVSPVRTGDKISYVWANLSSGVTATPPYRYFYDGMQGLAGFGGQFATYGKVINCATDFGGTALTLNLMGERADVVDIRTRLEITVPSTVSITYAV